VRCGSHSAHLRTFKDMDPENGPEQQPVKASALSNHRLNSWKEIAVFFDCDESTVKRWEKERALPVHRLPGSGRSGVFAYTDELSEWMATGDTGEGLTPESNSEAATHGTAQPEDELLPQTRAQPGNLNSPGTWRAALVLAVCLAVGLGILAIRGYHRRAAILAAAGRGPAATETLPAASHSSNREAEELYLEGRFHWNKRTPEDLRKALDYFTQAIVKDPNNAAAYIGMADCYNLLREYTLMPPAEAYPRALSAAQRAVALDGSSGEAHASLAFVTYFWLWNAGDAEREFKRAIALSPAYATAHHWYATFLMTRGRFQEAEAEIARAQELNPNSSSIMADKGLILFFADRPQQGMQLLKQLETTEPEFLSPHNYLAAVYLQSGNAAAYLAESRKAAMLKHDDNALTVVKAGEKGLADSGTRGMLEGMVRVQKQLYPRGLVSAYPIADHLALTGKNFEAMHYLQEAIDNRESPVLGLESDPFLKSLRDKPGYQDLVKQIGRPPQS
jgi:tetratricopeptide (TPR) repeat protein